MQQRDLEGSSALPADQLEERFAPGSRPLQPSFGQRALRVLDQSKAATGFPSPARCESRLRKPGSVGRPRLDAYVLVFLGRAFAACLRLAEVASPCMCVGPPTVKTSAQRL
jgi:hypothetical protein